MSQALYRSANQWIKTGTGNPDISLMYAQDAVGVFFTRWDQVQEGKQAWLERRRAIIDRWLEVDSDAVVLQRFDTLNPENWDAMSDWLHKWQKRFIEIVKSDS